MWSYRLGWLLRVFKFNRRFSGQNRVSSWHCTVYHFKRVAYRQLRYMYECSPVSPASGLRCILLAWLPASIRENVFLNCRRYVGLASCYEMSPRVQLHYTEILSGVGGGSKYGTHNPLAPYQAGFHMVMLGSIYLEFDFQSQRALESKSVFRRQRLTKVGLGMNSGEVDRLPNSIQPRSPRASTMQDRHRNDYC